ncbi:MAG: DUF488 domain-containing protein [Bacteroidales bacterium]|nr:DUF488 domain-containing protein [Bacteroidales bacterium]
MIILASQTILVFGQNDIRYSFTQTDSTLSFFGSFKTDAGTDCLLEIFYNYHHIKALAPSTMEVQLIDQGEGWNRFRYIYRDFIFFENVSVWNRKLDVENLRVDVYLESSVSNLAAVPKMISSYCFFRIKKQGEETIVEYHQQCQLTKASLTNLLLRTTSDALTFYYSL